MSKPVQSAQCHCSPIGFAHPQWSNTYYPEECPEDWRMAYFCNDFRAMYLPHQAWYQQTQITDQLVEELTEEKDGAFDLVMEWPPDLLGQSLTDALAQLLLLKAHIRSLVITSDFGKGREKQETLAHLNQRYVLSFENSGVNKEHLLAQHENQNTAAQNSSVQMLGGQPQVRCVYQSDQEFTFSPEGYHILRLPCLSLREYNPILSRLKKQLKPRVRVGLFIEPSPLSAQRAIEVRTMLLLMGLA